MEIEIKDYQGMKVMALSGEIDMYTSPALREEMMGLIDKRVTPLLIDFKGVPYIDSSGIATFVEGLKRMMSYGGRLKLIGLLEGVKEIFSFSKLDKVFEIYGSFEDALHS
ncbi:MAG: STAS domain-containing protein [Thermodesulfobacteriota bacterium]|jgi:anti-sigma B factor antagonist